MKLIPIIFNDWLQQSAFRLIKKDLSSTDFIYSTYTVRGG